jgi:hypothetical protein
MMNDALRRYLVESSEPLTKAELLRVIRQEIPALLRDPTNHPSARRRSASAGKN